MDDIKFKADDTGVDVTRCSLVFKGSFLIDRDISHAEFKVITKTWINIEDDANIIVMIFDEEIYKLDLIENFVEMKIDNKDDIEDKYK